MPSSNSGKPGISGRRSLLASARALAFAMLMLAGNALNMVALAQESSLVELEELLTKIYLAYGGKDALAALDKNYTLLGERKPAEEGAAAVKVRQLRKGADLRIDVEPGGEATPVSTVYDGTEAWKAAGKIVTDLSGDDADALKSERDHEPSVLVHFGEPDYKFKLDGRTTYHAAPVYSITVTHGDLSPATLYVDEKNYQVLALSYPGKTPEGKTTTVTLDYSQYRPAAGTLYPFKQIESIGDKPVSELTVTSIDTNSPVDDLQFRRPDRPREVRLNRAQVLPFEYSHKEIIVKVRLNDSEPLDFLLDTAASQTVVDRRTAAENFLDRGPNFTVSAVAGSVPTQMTSIRKLELGDAELADVQALILDLSSQTRQMGKRIAGIIGANVLDKFAVTIDYPKSKIILSDANSYKPPEKAIVVPFAQKQGPLVRAQVNGTDVLFLVDTGAAFNNLPTRIANKFLNGQTPHMTEGTGLDGHPVRLATLLASSVKLGSQPMKNVNFTYSVDQDQHVQSKGLIQTGTIGVLGNPFWQNFAVTFDYKFERLVLQPNTVLTAKQEIDQLIATGDAKLEIYRDLRAAESAYEKALMRVQSVGDPKLQARIWGRIGNLRRIMAKDLNRPEQARIAYEYFSKAQDLSHKLQDRETEGRILADWSLLYLDNGQIPAAQQALQGATLYAPQDPQVNVDFAVYLYKMQMYADMQKYLEKALFLDPSDWQALWYKVKLANMFNDVPQEKETLKEILKYYPWSKLAKDKLAALNAPPQVVAPGAAPTGTPTAVSPLNATPIGLPNQVHP